MAHMEPEREAGGTLLPRGGIPAGLAPERMSTFVCSGNRWGQRAATGRMYRAKTASMDSPFSGSP